MTLDFHKLDELISSFMRRWGVLALRVSLGIIFIWFGLLKPLGISAAIPLVKSTTSWMPVFGPDGWVAIIGWWEVAIGICFLFQKTLRIAIALLAVQMFGTFLPLFLLPEVTFQAGMFPFAPALEGQYIIKNLMIISAALVVGGTVRINENPVDKDTFDFEKIDQSISQFMQRYGIIALRLSLGAIFIWFGMLKPMGMSPVIPLVKATTSWMPFLSPDQWVVAIGMWEVAIGVFFIFHDTIRIAIGLLAVQMFGTFLPLFILPDVTFQSGMIPFAPTLEGQYIIKNLMIISAALVVGGTVKRNEPTK